MLDVGIYLDGHLRCSLTALNDAVEAFKRSRGAYG